MDKWLPLPQGPLRTQGPCQPVFQGQHTTGVVIRQSLHNPPKPLRAIHTLHQHTSSTWLSATTSSSVLRSGGPRMPSPRWGTVCCPRPGHPQPVTATLRGGALLASKQTTFTGPQPAAHYSKNHTVHQPQACQCPLRLAFCCLAHQHSARFVNLTRHRTRYAKL